MRYQGGKTRIAKHLAVIINKELLGKDYYELFVGSNNLIKHLEGYTSATLLDLNKYVIAYHQQVQKGWKPTDEFNEDNEPKLKAIHKLCRGYIRGKIPHCKYSDGFIGYILNQCSFGGDFNGGFINNGINDYLRFRNETYNKNWVFKVGDYQDLDIKGGVIYLDPPYKNTTGYAYSINHDTFWDWVRELSKWNKVFISEQNAPDDFEVVWQKEHTRTLNHFNTNKTKAQRIKIEKLFTLKV